MPRAGMRTAHESARCVKEHPVTWNKRNFCLTGRGMCIALFRLLLVCARLRHTQIRVCAGSRVTSVLCYSLKWMGIRRALDECSKRVSSNLSVLYSGG
jgi:hypothetical protein